MDIFSYLLSQKGSGGAGNIEKYIEQGRQEEWSEFWDEFQQNGNRENYSHAFYGDSWTVKNFKPKYDISGVQMPSLFAFSKLEGNLKEILDKQGVVLDLSNTKNLSTIFQGSLFTKLPELIAPKTNQYTYAFDSMPNLETVKLVSNLGFKNITGMFRYCVSLKNLELIGPIDSKDLNVQWSPLTHDSLINILNNLVDKSADTSSSWTVTLGPDNIAKLTSDELKIAENKGWVVV